MDRALDVTMVDRQVYGTPFGVGKGITDFGSKINFCYILELDHETNPI